MKIAVLSRDAALYTNRRFCEAARRRASAIAVIDPLADPDAITVADYAAVIPRFGPIWQAQGGRLLAQLQATGAVCLNTAEAMALARNKPLALQVFRQQGLPMPASVSAAVPLDAAALQRLPFGFPMLIKQDISAGGWGVHRVDDMSAALALMARLSADGIRFTVQAYIAEAAGRDVRVFVCEGRVIAAMQRIAADGEFRANMQLGARAEAVCLHPAESELALQATAALGLLVAGVDLLRTRAGPLLLEVNAAPGFEALERLTGCDIAGTVLDCLISRVNRQPRVGITKSSDRINKILM